MTAAASELWNLASRTVKDALRPGTMPGKRKRKTKEAMAAKALQRCLTKHKRETKEAMAQRLADGSGRTLAECMNPNNAHVLGVCVALKFYVGTLVKVTIPCRCV